MCAPLSLAVAAAAAAELTILTVETPTADGRVTVVADVQPAGATPIGSESFTVTAGSARLPTRVEPVLSDQLAVGLVVDGSTAGGATLHAEVSGPANLLLQLPVAARVAAVADTSPPAVVAPLTVGAQDALSALDALQPHGQRQTSQALTAAVRELPVTPGEPRLVVLYTGAVDAGGEAATDLAERLRTAHTLLAVVSNAADSSYWSQVTAATGGLLVAPQASDPIRASESLLDRLRARYLLTFPTPQQLPARVSVRVDTTAGAARADAFVPREATPDRPGDPGSPGLLLPALSAAALVLFAAAGLRARPAARSRSAGRPPTAVRGRRSAARPAPPVRERPQWRATPIAGTSAASAVPESVHPVPARASAAPPPGPVRVAEAAEAAGPSAARGEPEPVHPVPPPATALPQRATAPAQEARADPGTPEKEAGQTAWATGDALYLQVAAAAAAVDDGQMDRSRAVAQIALAAPGRIDLLDRVMDARVWMARSDQASRPPADTALDLLKSARRVITGEATLTGPDGVRVEQTVPPGADRITRTLLRLTRNGRWECDCRTADELARHVDLSTLVTGPSDGTPRR